MMFVAGSAMRSFQRSGSVVRARSEPSGTPDETSSSTGRMSSSSAKKRRKAL